MQALQESGFAGNTLVMFLSDNGIAIPFAKCNAYLASTRHTLDRPLARRGQSRLPRPPAHDLGYRLFPNDSGSCGSDHAPGLDGFSFLPLLQGGTQAGRDQVFTQIDMKAGGDAVPMRCVQNRRLGYIFSPWSDGKFVYRNNNEGLTMKAMVEAAKTDPRAAQRVRMFRYRTFEELYDLQNDPDCLTNLVDKPDRKDDLDRMRSELHAWMQRTHDPLLPAFENRTNLEKGEGRAHERLR